MKKIETITLECVEKPGHESGKILIGYPNNYRHFGTPNSDGGTWDVLLSRIKDGDLLIVKFEYAEKRCPHCGNKL